MLTGISFSDDTQGQSFSYNHLGQLTQVVDASGTRAFSYNQYGELESENLAANGNAYQLAEHYDELGRPNGYSLAAEDRSIQNTFMGYDQKGRLASLSADGRLTLAPSMSTGDGVCIPLLRSFFAGDG